jgi:hypothetical protein
MDIRTIVSKEDWKEFAEKLHEESQVEFVDGDAINDYNPFEDLDCKFYYYCIFELNDVEGFIVVDYDIDASSQILNNDSFIERCSVKFPKKGVATKEIKEKLGSGCFVVEDEWEKFSGLLEKLTSIKWLAGQKPEDYCPFCADSYAFISLSKKDGAECYGICVDYPEDGVNYLTQTDFIHMCSELFPKD